MAERVIAIVIYDGHQVLDLAGPHEVFYGANRQLDVAQPEADRYRIEIVGPSEMVRSESGLALSPTQVIGAWEPEHLDTLMVVGGRGDRKATADEELVAWVARHGQSARRVTSVCSGTILLAEAGLISDETVTTHWFRAPRLKRQFPALDVQINPLYVRSGADGRVWTSAGVTAGIDLSLALVEADHGAEVAHTIARWLVMFLRRPGGQSQFAVPLWPETPELDAIVAVCEYAQANPAANLSVTALAERAAMSPRHFSRVFCEETGTSPGRYMTQVRLAEARRLLESTTLTTDVVACHSGFGTAESLRRAFLRHLGVSPSAYRSRFSTTSPAEETTR